jgi:thioesterase domain-containing protein
VNDTEALCSELEATWRSESPLAAALDIRVTEFRDHVLRVRAPLPPNRNIHGTAFAGSLFSVCVLTGWGAVWLALRERGLTGDIVVADSRIRYRRAVAGEILCCCSTNARALDESLEQLGASGRANIPLVCTVDVDGRHAVTFEGSYVVLGKRSE